MSDYWQYVQERDKIDFFIQKGYTITTISEDYNGALVLFEKNNSPTEKNQREIVRVSTANGRKYFAVKLIQQNQKKL